MVSREQIGGYAEPLQVYAERYGAGLPTIKRWVGAGRRKGDAPPLDSPVEMPGWWTRNFKQAVPPKLIAACVGRPARGKPAPERVERRPAPMALEPVVVESTDDEELAKAKREVDTAAQELELARQSGEAGPEQVGLLLKNQAAALANRDRVIAAQKQRMIDAGTLIEKSKANLVLSEFHAAIAQAMRGIYYDFCEEMKRPHQPIEEEAFQACLDRRLSALHQEVFR